LENQKVIVPRNDIIIKIGITAFIYLPWSILTAKFYTPFRRTVEEEIGRKGEQIKYFFID